MAPIMGLAAYICKGSLICSAMLEKKKKSYFGIFFWKCYNKRLCGAAEARREDHGVVPVS